MGALEGALRIMPAWEWNVFRLTIAFNVFIPALVPLGIIFTGAALWPFAERWITGDYREHHVNDRPRNAPTRTAIGLAALIAYHFHIDLYTTTWIARIAIFAGPVTAYWAVGESVGVRTVQPVQHRGMAIAAVTGTSMGLPGGPGPRRFRCGGDRTGAGAIQYLVVVGDWCARRLPAHPEAGPRRRGRQCLTRAEA